MTHSQVLTAVLPALPSAPCQGDEDELARLRDLEKVVLRLTHGLGFGHWDVPNKGGVAGNLVAAVTELHLDAELEVAIREAYAEKLVELGIDVKAISEPLVAEHKRRGVDISPKID